MTVVVRSGRDFRRIGFDQSGTDGIDPRGGLDRGSRDSDPDLAPRLVCAAALVPHEWHRESHRATLTAKGASDYTR